jgi:hypothetical protein
MTMFGLQQQNLSDLSLNNCGTIKLTFLIDILTNEIPVFIVYLNSFLLERTGILIADCYTELEM